MVSLHFPVNLSQLAAELVGKDEIPDVNQLLDLRQTSPFSGMKPSAEKFPGAMILRRCTKGRTLFHQGDPGQTAFLILTATEALGVFRAFHKGALQRQEVMTRTQMSGPLQESHQARGAQSPSLPGQHNQHASLQALESEIERLESHIAERTAEATDCLRQVAEARLLAGPENPSRRKGLLHRLVAAMTRRAARPETQFTAQSIPSDGPQDLHQETLCAPLYEGDVIGEASCLHFAPRSSTVTITEGTDASPVYVMEIMRHVLEALCRNASFRKKIDETYRQRAMESHIRSLPMFRTLTDDDYAWLSPQLELESFSDGQILQDEYQTETESCYLIRNGVVRVMQNLGCLLSAEELSDPKKTLLSIFEWKNRAGLPEQIFGELPTDLQKLVETASEEGFCLKSEQVELLRCGLNTWIQTSRIATTQIQSEAGCHRVIGHPEWQLNSSVLPVNKATWGPLEFRILNRTILETLCRECLERRSTIATRRRTVNYATRGEVIGEMTALHNQESYSTSIAFSHDPQQLPRTLATKKVSQSVDVVRIPVRALRELAARSPKFRQYVQQSVPGPVPKRPTKNQTLLPVSASDTREFQAMGLAWGQSLMVIDLDRCTRCNECVRACVDSHDDGRTRLHLDGPRFENRYLVPATCRSCLDPVCMIGCPVGAIHRGDRGEVWISDHCIGCSRCADQCPYGSIQMDLLSQQETATSGFHFLSSPEFIPPVTHEKAVVCDQCRFTPSGKPACLYACPHDAAIRVDGRAYFKGTDDADTENRQQSELCHATDS